MTPNENLSGSIAHKELRLGLVCYGGVSLAIYMHGIAKELHKLVIASRAYEEDPGGNPFSTQQVEHTYWEALRHADSTQGVRTRVVIDAIAGTSAGGINGVFLAKALSRNRSQDPLTRMWFEKGDIKQLLGGKLKAFSKGVGILAGLVLPGKKAKPPLRGNAMLSWLGEALDAIDASPPPAQLADLPTLLPDAHDLDLFVTTTDSYGYTRQIPIADPPAVSEKRHRHVIHFRHSRGQFDASHNAALALASRCTSSFPGAFPPVGLGDLRTALGLSDAAVQEIEEEFFPEYALSGHAARKTLFVDGGVIDNKPFGHTIRAISEKAATVEVDRKLLYIEPDPSYKPPQPDETEPSLLKTAWAGMSSIAGYEPILDDILEVEALNRRIDRVNEIVADCSDSILLQLRQLGAFDVQAEKSELAAMRGRIKLQAEQTVGTAQRAYFLLKIHSVVDQFAFCISEICGFPRDSNARAFVRHVTHEWAMQRRLIGAAPDRAKQEAFLETFDLGYTRRRILFVIQGVNQIYADLPLAEGARPVREELDTAKAVLYRELGFMLSLIGAGDLPPAAVERIERLFSNPVFDFASETIAEKAGAFVAAHGLEMDALESEIGQHLMSRREAVRTSLFSSFRETTSSWLIQYREQVLSRYLGFPFWDSLIYPIQALSDSGEVDRVDVVRLSPEESTAIPLTDQAGKGRTAAKLRGVAKAHFGAFFKRKYRENDYLWGRLDAAERLLGLVLPHRPQADELKPAFTAILAEEAPHLKEIRKAVKALRRTVDRL